MNNLSTPYYLMPKPIGPACNMDCTYCYYLDKKTIYKQCSDFAMSDEVLEIFTRQYIESQPGNVLFTWHGGEPLLRGIEFYKKAFSLQTRFSNGKHIENTIQTNGLLITEDWCRFFKDNNILVGISIDGPEHIHDKYRKLKNGNPTFALVMQAIELFQKYDVQFNNLSVVSDYGSRFPLQVYNFFKEIGSKYMQFTPVVECRAKSIRLDKLQVLAVHESNESMVTAWSVASLAYGQFLTAIFDEWVSKDVGEYFVQFFDSVLANWCGLAPGVCTLTKDCGYGAVLEHNGDIYVCDHYVFPEYRLGNLKKTAIHEVMFSEKHKLFGAKKMGSLTDDCKSCAYVKLCNGECPKNRFAVSSSGESGQNYLCAGLKHFFLHTESHMRFMRNEILKKRNAANVMEWVNSGGVLEC
jgi:uncharacterized protein